MSEVSQEQLSALAQRLAVVETLTRDSQSLRERLTRTEVEMQDLARKVETVEQGARKLTWTVIVFVLLEVLKATVEP